MRLLELMLVRRWWLAPLGAAVGILVGVVVALLGSAERRAEAALLISSPAGPSAVNPQLANLRELGTSGVLAGNVRATLRLEESPAEIRDRLDASVRPRSQVIIIGAADGDPEKARQLAQEAGGVFMQLVEARFGDRRPPLQAAMLDSAHVLSASERPVARNMLVGGALGLLLGTVAALLLRGEARSDRAAGGDPSAVAAATRDLGRRESVLERRIEMLSSRERELARRAGQLAAREADLERRERELETRPAPEAMPAAPLGDEGGDELTVAAPPERIREPEAVPQPAAVRVEGGGWNLQALETLVRSEAGARPERHEEWNAYLFFLREHADADGTLPSSFDGLVSDVFGAILGPPGKRASGEK